MSTWQATLDFEDTNSKQFETSTPIVDCTQMDQQTMKSLLVVAATGLGKTVIMGGLARSWPKGRVMMISHRYELNTQAIKSFEWICGEDVDLEQAHFKADQRFDKTRIVVASVQTLNSTRRGKMRMERFDPEEFGLLLIDEAHRSAAASYRRVIEYMRQNKNLVVVGVTATPDRLDGVGLGCVYEKVSCNLDMLWGVKNGWLVSPRQVTVTLERLDLSQIRTVGGDLDEKQLAKVVMEEENLHGMAKPIVDFAGTDKQSIVFAASVAHAQRLSELIRDYYIRAHGPTDAPIAVSIDGSMNPQHPDRIKIVKDFKEGKIQFLCNCGVATEGFDAPNVRLVAIGRPTKSRAMYCFDSKTEVLTQNGWVTGESVDVGTPILAFNPKTNAVQFEAVKGFVKRPLNPDEQFVEIDSASVDCRVTTSHRMCLSVRKGRDRSFQPWKFMQASQMLELRDKFRAPAAGYAEHPGVSLTDDDLRFIAWVMTDGCFNRSNNVIQISQQYPDQRIEIERVLSSCGFKWRMSATSKPTHYGPRKYPLVIYRVSFGKPRGEDKHLSGWSRFESWIPKVDQNAWSKLEAMDNRQFSVFLETWHRGDGCKQKGQPWTRRSYHLAVGKDNKWVADWIQKMCIMRGWRCNIGWSGTAWVVHCKDVGYRSVNPKDVRLTPATNEDVWCVSVPSGALFVRRNGKVVVAGNTQMIGRGTRPLVGVVDQLGMSVADRLAAIAASDKKQVDVLDFIGQSSRHKLVCTASILAGDEPDDIVQAANRISSAKDFDGSTLDAIEEAKEAKRLEQEARRKKVTVGVEYRAREQSSEVWSLDEMPKTTTPGFLKNKRLSDAQTKMLTRLGFTTAQIEKMTVKEASKNIDFAIRNPRTSFAIWLKKQKIANGEI